MLLISDSNDSTGNGMFSKEGRKLNQFFINLCKRDQKVATVFLNQLLNAKSNQTKTENNHNPIPISTSVFPKRLSKHAQQPFSKFQGRAYYQNLDLKKMQAPSFANYRITEFKSKVKVLRNYNFEKPTRKMSEQISRPKSDSNTSAPSCKRLLISFQAETLPVQPRLVGFNDFNRQLTRPSFIPMKKDFENELDAATAADRCKVTFNKSFMDFSKSIGRFHRLKKDNLQRNNYALNVKRELVEPNTGIIVPNFTKTLDRKVPTPKSSCLNKGFYDYQLISKHLSTPNFKLRVSKVSKGLSTTSNHNISGKINGTKENNEFVQS